MKIGILQCGHAAAEVIPTHGDYNAMFARLLAGHDFDLSTWDVENMDFPDSIHAVEGWLLSGSRHGAYDKLPFIPPLEDFIRAAYAAHVPMVGVCFGHQIIAQALGGKVEKFDHGWAIGPTKYDFKTLGKLRLNAWHQDQVVVLPKEAKGVASNDFCRNAALVYGNRVFSVQPHPEFTNQLISTYLTLRKGKPGYSDQVMDAAAGQLDLATDNAVLGAEFARFFRAAYEAQNDKLD